MQKSPLRKQILCIVLFLACFAQMAQAGAGFFGSPFGAVISLNVNGAGTSNYRNSVTTLSGTVTSLAFNGGFIHTWKDGSGNICGGTLYYRVYKIGDTPPVFSTFALNFSSNHSFTTSSTEGNINSSSGTDQRWGGTGANVDLLSGLSDGSCRLEYYYEATGNGSGSSGCGNTFSYGTSGVPYTIDFTRGSIYVTVADGLWSNTATWQGNVVPPADAIVTIAHVVTLDLNVSVTNITISGSVTSESGQARQLTVKGDFTNNGSFVANDGLVLFSSGGTRNILGTTTTTFYYVETTTTVDFVGTATAIVSGTFTIKSGGNVNTASAPFYANNSTLKFDMGGSIYAGEFWYKNNASGNSGVPKNVTIANGTTLNFGADGQYRQMDGNLLIETGATFTLSTSAFGDLYIKGNFMNNGTFNHNNKGTYFNGSSEQTITHTSVGMLAFGYFIVDKSANNVKLMSDINIVGGSSSGNALEIKQAGKIDLNDRTITYNNNGVNDITVRDGNCQMINSGSGTGIFELLAPSSGSNISCDLYSSNGGVWVFATNTKLSIKGTAPSIGYSLLNITGNFLTIQSLLEINNRGALEASGTAPTYASGSILRYNNNGEYIRNKEWSANSGAGYPYHVEIRNNSFFYLGGNGGLSTARTIGGNLTIESGSLFELSNQQTSPTYMTASLTVLGNVDNAGTLNLSTQAGGDLNIAGNFTNDDTFSASQRTVTFNGTGTQSITANANTIFYNLTINKSAGLAKIAGSQTGINVSNLLKLDGANTADLDLNYHHVFLGNAGIMLENRVGNVIVTDNTPTIKDGDPGGAVILTNRTIPTALVGTGGMAGTGIDLASSSSTISGLTMYRYHYRGGSLSFNAGIKKVYRLETGAFGANTVTLRIYYATQEVVGGMTVNKMYRWSKTTAPMDWNKYEVGELVGSDDVLVNSISAFSHWTLGQDNLPLAVSMQSFVGKKIADTESKLDWTTSNERNHAGFYVEKSYNGLHFKTIGFVEGAGENNRLRNYGFYDKEFLFSAYYRLRQVDNAGNLTYSSIIWVENAIFRLFPNPNVGKITLITPVEATAKIQLVLLDMLGRQVGRQDTTAEQGSPTLSRMLSSLPAGTYLLTARAGTKQWREKVIKL